MSNNVNMQNKYQADKNQVDKKGYSNKHILEQEQVIEMSFNTKSSISQKDNLEPLPNETHSSNETDDLENTASKYIYALLYDNNLTVPEAKEFVKTHLQPIASTASVTHLKKENQFFLWVWHTDGDKIQKLIQAVINNGKYIYINDGSDVIFRPGMRYNQINHQRMQLMNYRCYLDRNDPKKFKMLVRPIYFNKQYWIIEDGKKFAEMMKDAFTRKNTTSTPSPNSQGKQTEYEIDHTLIRRWVDKGLVHAQYESLKFKRQDLKAEFEKTKELDYNPKLLKAIKDIEGEIKEMRSIYGRRFKEIKKKDELEEQRIKHKLSAK